MKYDFYVLTNQGLKNTTVDSEYDFDCAPFGFVPYRVVSSCECAAEVIADFWRCVDLVLASNSLTSEDYVRTVRAYTETGELYGELDSSK